MITDNQGVCRSHARQMAVFGNQRPQNRNQFQGVGIINLDNTGDQLLGGRLRKSVQVLCRLFGIDLLDNFDDFLSGDRSKTVHIQHCQEKIVDFVLVHGGTGQYRHFPFNPGIHHKAVAGYVCHLGDEGPNVRILEVQPPGFFLRLRQRSQRQ